MTVYSYSVRLFMIMYVLECARSMSWSSRTGPSRVTSMRIYRSRAIRASGDRRAESGNRGEEEC